MVDRSRQGRISLADRTTTTTHRAWPQGQRVEVQAAAPVDSVAMQAYLTFQAEAPMVVE